MCAQHQRPRASQQLPAPPPPQTLRLVDQQWSAAGQGRLSAVFGEINVTAASRRALDRQEMSRLAMTARPKDLQRRTGACQLGQALFDVDQRQLGSLRAAQLAKRIAP